MGVDDNKTKKVRFSRGGLTNDCIYDGDHNLIGRTWRFMPKQYQYDYDYGTRGCNLLTWSCEKTQFGTTNSPSLEDDDSFVGWGMAFGDGSVWESLTLDEWQYLMGRNDSSEKPLHGMVTITLDDRN